MSKKLIYLFLVVSLGINVGMIATTIIHRMPPAHQGPPPGPGGKGGPEPMTPPDPGKIAEDHVRGMTQHLDLDAEQQQAVREVLEKHAPQLVKFQIDVEEKGRRLAEAFAAPAFDPVQFQQLTAEASAARSRLDSLSAVMLVAEAAVLTPEQRLKFAEVATSIHLKPQQPPGRGGPPPRR
jgi:Spy/CpxP family protein refolding chaperone